MSNKNKSFFLFHLNLAFSSIEEDQHIEVIEKCYFPLLNIFSKHNIKFGIELTGWTLNRIHKIYPEWVEMLKNLINLNQVELVGSGYAQIIGPLAPYDINIKNHEIGIKHYQDILDIVPETVLVNEMVYSNSMAEIYQEVGYKNMIMDGDNLSLSLNIRKSDFFKSTYATGNRNKKLIKLLPTDSIIFQKFQRVAHSEISVEEYMDYLAKILSNNDNVAVPIYCNDAEIFNFRPGRFAEEAKIEHDEWSNIENILKLLKSLDTHEIVFPRDICKSWKTSDLHHFNIESLSYPVPVKKQKKYNLARWAVTGRNDNKLNSICYSIYQKYKQKKDVTYEEWMELIFFWSSDHRTHITKKRWKVLNKSLNSFTELKTPSDNIFNIENNMLECIKEDDIFFYIRTDHMFITLNKNKGLAIHDGGLITNNLDMNIIGTVEHGSFDNIELGADFFSGSLVIQDMETSSLYTDLQKTKPSINFQNNYIKISSEIILNKTKIIKNIHIYKDKPTIKVSYILSKMKRSRETLRLSAVTLKTLNLEDIDCSVSSKTGGKHSHVYHLDKEFDHGNPVSHRISSTAALPATDGKINFFVNNVSLSVSWDPDKSYFYPLLSNTKDAKGSLIRLHLSSQETDDTLKVEGFYENLEYSINFL